MNQFQDESKKKYIIILMMAILGAYPLFTYYKESSSFSTDSFFVVGLILYILFHYLILVPFALWKILRSKSVSTVKPNSLELPPELPPMLRKVLSESETNYDIRDSLIGFVSGSGFNWKDQGDDFTVELRTVEKFGVPFMLISSTAFFLWIAQKEFDSGKYLLLTLALLTFIFSIKTFRKGQRRLLFNKSTQTINLIENGVKTQTLSLTQTPICSRESIQTTHHKKGTRRYKIWVLTVGKVTLLSMRDQDQFKLLIKRLQDQGYNVVLST